MNRDQTRTSLRCRRAATLRCKPIDRGIRDPWADSCEWTSWIERDPDSWRAAVEHLTACGLFGRWQAPEAVRNS